VGCPWAGLHAEMRCIQQQAFDTEVFEVPFYRVIEFDMERVEMELDQIKAAHTSFIVDAKVPSYQNDWNSFLQDQGFHKACLQVELCCNINAQNMKSHGVRIMDQIEFDDELIKKHAENFIYDRFSSDAKLNVTKSNELYQRWMRNSLNSRAIKVAVIGRNLCTFKEKEEKIIIDLISVLDKKQGIAVMLLSAINNHAFDHQYGMVIALTEAENVPALRLYQRMGFEVSGFYSCFHMIMG
jgi:RimJ/RimL family protein N-acetyltransferase